MSVVERGASVHLVGVSKRYDGHAAVEGVDIEVAPGEFVSLLGPSGSGKTTTLNMIAGFTQPTTGTISMDGRVLDRLPPHRRDIGVVFQHYALFPHMTIAQNIAFPLRQRKIRKSEIEARVDEILRMVSLEGLGGRFPRQVSGGQQQRVAVGRALAFQPRLILMDEPLGALDKNLRSALQREISRLHRELGITFVYVTHDQDEALALSDRIVVFNNARVEQIGTPTELYDSPESLFVANFLGESNVFTGRVDHEAGGLATPHGLLRADLRSIDGHDRASLVVRPERCRVRCAEDVPTDPGSNSLPATVRSVLQLGATVRIETELPDGTVLVSRRMSDGPTGYHGGDRVDVTWNVEDSIVLAPGD